MHTKTYIIVIADAWHLYTTLFTLACSHARHSRVFCLCIASRQLPENRLRVRLWLQLLQLPYIQYRLDNLNAERVLHQHVHLPIRQSAWFVKADSRLRSCTISRCITLSGFNTKFDFCLYTSCTCRPVARIFRRGVTWMSNLHKRTRLGGSGGMLPHECSEIASEAILGQRQSFNS